MFKKLLIGILLFSGISIAQDITGAGTRSDPYILYNAADVDSIRHLGNDKYYLLNNDINMKDLGVDWTPMPAGRIQIFDGQGFTIDSMVISAASAAMGFMVSTSGTADTIKNVRFANAHIKAPQNSTSATRGIVVGQSYSFPVILENVVVDSSIIEDIGTGGIGYTGGILGGMGPSTIIYRCAVTNTQFIQRATNATQHWGGLVGTFGGANSTIEQSYVQNIYIGNRGGSNNTSHQSAFIGQANQGTANVFIKDSYALYVEIVDSIISSSASLDASGKGALLSNYAGANPANNLRNTYGVAKIEFRLNTTYNSIGYGVRNTSAVDTSSFVDTTFYGISRLATSTTFPPVLAMQRKNSTQMKTQSMYENAGWDFDAVWAISPSVNDGYPYLQWQPVQTDVIITNPIAAATYYYTDAPLNISWTGTDTAVAYYQLEPSASFLLLDTLTSSPYAWDFIADKITGNDISLILTKTDSTGGDTVTFNLHGTINISYPVGGEIFSAIDTIDIAFGQLGADSVYVEYTDDGEFSWTLISYRATPDSANTLSWYPPTSGSYKIRVMNKDYAYGDTTGTFTSDIVAAIIILSPIDSSLSYASGTTAIDIVIETRNIDQFTLYYSISDSLNWIIIESDIPVSGGIDTTTYNWTLPDIFGEIWLLAREVSDTAVYILERSSYAVGRNLRSWPWICWYEVAAYPDYTKNLVNYARTVDGTCGWGFAGPRRITAVIGDYAEAFGITYLEDDNYPAGWPDPILPEGTYQYTALDTNYVELGIFYPYTNNNTPVTYRGREYYIVQEDTALYANDLINGIDSLKIADLKSYVGVGWLNISSISTLKYIQIYNVQRSKIQGDYYPINQDYESLNDAYFSPLILVGGETARGLLIVAIEAPSYPVTPTYVQDVARIFTSLSYTRDYFRGIHPKAEKRNDPNNP